MSKFKIGDRVVITLSNSTFKGKKAKVTNYNGGTWVSIRIDGNSSDHLANIKLVRKIGYNKRRLEAKRLPK